MNEPMNTIRAFIAVHLPLEVKNALGDIARELSAGVSRGAVRWVGQDQMHLTLRFLGDTAVASLPAIQATMDDTALSQSRFVMVLGELGCFPSMKRPRVIWVGLSGEADRLLSLKTALDERLSALGLPPEDKAFRAHLTLGRVKDERAVQNVRWIAEVPPLEVPINAIHLIESRLRPEGPLYTVRHTSRLSAEQ